MKNEKRVVKARRFYSRGERKMETTTTMLQGRSFQTSSAKEGISFKFVEGTPLYTSVLEVLFSGGLELRNSTSDFSLLLCSQLSV